MGKYEDLIPLLADFVINGVGWGRSSASVDLERLAKDHAELIVPYALREYDNPHIQRDFFRILRGIYDERMERIALQWTYGEDDDKFVGMMYLASVDSKYAPEVIMRLSKDNGFHTRERAGIASGKLLEARKAKLEQDLSE